MTDTKAYILYCRTGCTCCSSENHYRGPFSTREAAEERAEHYKNSKLLASQYAPRGHYDVEEYDAEILSDGRIIVDDTVFEGWADDGCSDWIEAKWD